MNKFLAAGLLKTASAQGLRKEALFKSLKRAKQAALKSRDVLGAMNELGANMGIQRQIRKLPGIKQLPGVLKDKPIEGIGWIGGKGAKLGEDLKYLKKHINQGTRRGVKAITNLIKDNPGYSGLLGGTILGAGATELGRVLQDRLSSEVDEAKDFGRRVRGIYGPIISRPVTWQMN